MICNLPDNQSNLHIYKNPRKEFCIRNANGYTFSEKTSHLLDNFIMKIPRFSSLDSQGVVPSEVGIP